jgi:uncharacterized protein
MTTDNSITPDLIVNQQHRKLGLICGIVGIFILGCSLPVRSTLALVGKNLRLADSKVESKSPVRGQKLPVTASVRIGKENILLEVAHTPQEGQIGLMYRTDLADNRGMLFIFEPPQPVRFWMKNTLIPLDMIFLSRGVVKHIGAEILPCPGDPCPDYGPDRSVKIDEVIELRGGRAAELRLKVGDRLKIRPFSAKKLK